MPKQVIMPQFGESVVEGTLTKWLKAVGERVEEFEPLLEINTDKVDTEIPSPASGIVIDILAPEGTVVQAGAILALIDESGASAATQPIADSAQPGFAQPIEPSPVLGHPEAASPPSAGRAVKSAFISPLVARMAREHNLDLGQISGSGAGGRITKHDVLAYLAAQSVSAAPEKQPGESVRFQPTAPSQVTLQLPGDQILSLNPVRRAIAEHMVFSERTSPHVTTVMEADLSRVLAHRQANKGAFARDGVNLTFTAYFIAAAISALKTYPLVNSSWSEQGIVLHRDINFGMATSLGEDGLIVPVIKGAESLSLLGLARAINDLAERARARQLKPDEVRGGTFTITNHGTSGSLFATPIINQPQCAILGVGAIQKRVVVISDPGAGDALAIRPMAYLSLTFDHRILDGAVGDAFLGKMVELLASW